MFNVNSLVKSPVLEQQAREIIQMKFRILLTIFLYRENAFMAVKRDYLMMQ